MKINVKFKDEDGNVTVEGFLNRNEVSFLLQYAINNLMADGVMFNITGDQDEDPDDDAPSRITYPEGTLN